MNSTLTFGAALLLGLAASGHCLVMCGGITAALGVATARGSRWTSTPALLIGLSARAHRFVFARRPAVRRDARRLDRVAGYRIGAAHVACVVCARAAACRARRVRSSARSGSCVRPWALAQACAARSPVAADCDSLPRAFAFGMVWGWMPCGFVYTVLLIATLQQSASTAP